MKLRCSLLNVTIAPFAVLRCKRSRQMRPLAANSRSANKLNDKRVRAIRKILIAQKMQKALLLVPKVRKRLPNLMATVLSVAKRATELLTAGSTQNCKRYLPAVQRLGRRALQFPNRETEGTKGVWGVQAWGWAWFGGWKPPKRWCACTAA